MPLGSHDGEYVKDLCGRNGHLAAFVGATLALVRAALAMVGLVLSARGATGVTYLGAQRTKLLHELRSAAHEGRRRPTRLGAIPIQADTLRHHGNVLFTKACIGAMLAFLGASNTSFDA